MKHVMFRLEYDKSYTSVGQSTHDGSPDPFHTPHSIDMGRLVTLTQFDAALAFARKPGRRSRLVQTS